jgi:hypothetical protein
MGKKKQKKVYISLDTNIIPVPPNPMRPDVEVTATLGFKEFQPDGQMISEMVNESNDYLKCYYVGECSVIVTREFGRWHISISHWKRYPSWEEVSYAWYQLVPGAGESVEGVMILPKISQYVNLNRYCLHVFELDKAWMSL